MPADTLKLFFSPGACSFASHMALEEAGADYETVRVNFAAAEQRSPEYLRINPKGRVPALAVGDWVLTENPAILRYVARRYPAAKLWPEDPVEEARCMEWLSWICSGVHVAYAHVRRPDRYATGDAAKENVVAKGKESAREVWEAVEKKLAAGSGPWAAGSSFSVADLYLLVFWTWGAGSVLGYDMEKDFPAWTALAKRVSARPAVRKVAEREGQALPA